MTRWNRRLDHTEAQKVIENTVTSQVVRLPADFLFVPIKLVDQILGGETRVLEIFLTQE